MSYRGRVGLLTYSTKPRGGVVHTLALAEALVAAGVDVHIFALGGEDGAFFRDTQVPFTLFPAPSGIDSLEEKVFASVDSIATGLAGVVDEFDLFHSQDCISARAATRIRDEKAGPPVLRTVHHVDDFTTPALIDCQRKAIIEPDHLLVVSEQWRGILREEYGVTADVVRNGVDPSRFPPVTAQRRAELRASVGAEDRFLFISVGGIEPRKGSKTLFEALGLLRDRGLRPVLVVLGGHSFQDYEAYRREALAMLPDLGLELGTDVIGVGTVSEDVLGAWYRSADALAFPSVKEGFGLVALEGLAAGLPVVASDLPVFREFLTDGRDALLPAVGEPTALADALERVMTDERLRSTLVAGGHTVLPSFTWSASAARHAEIYQAVRPI
ncbi:MSMEG_0565 family glycosyltransferase [Planosporangium flavigriseum]|uniref:Glycosyl transferase family 1 n=1 Tax=Planosporangium flavigriseum TaxID=373681 RepID=A0A8J3LLU4_9ACTN|nr:MSMEG_0565 family glycosyltransferase [Planosporangium flavigriseum]NJC63028.1 MSMEG_0565 family glycosyltransferase [Planosporangium flavigriseum]GIG73100.1 glycosyl transferase family 1 [Planosporangium flavigriseum]